MKTFPNHLATMAGGLTGFLAMAVIGWNVTGESLKPVDESKAPSAPRSSRVRPPRSTGARNAAAAKIASIRSARSPEERFRGTIDLANTLPLSEFGKWLAGGWFTLREGAEFTLFKNILRDRWLLEDPEGFVLWTIEKNSNDASSLLATWTEGHPEKFLNFFRRHPNNVAEFDVLADIAKDQPDLALKALLEMDAAGISDRDLNGSDIGNNLLQILAEKSPATFEASLALFEEPVKRRAAEVLREQKFKTNHTEELQKLFAEPDGFETYYHITSRVTGMSGNIVDHLANLPPSWRSSVSANARIFIDAESAEKWWNADLAGAGFSKSDIDSIRKQALLKVAENHPTTAFQRITELKLSDELSEGIQMSVIGMALNKHRDMAAKLIKLLPQGENREFAMEALAGTPEPQGKDLSIKIETPEQWLEKATVVDSESSLYGSILKNWPPAKLASLGSQFQTLPYEQKQRVAKIISASSRDYDSFSPPVVGEAIRYLLIHPPSDETDQTASEVRRASAYAANLAVKEPETGRDWVDSLPEGQPKLWASKNLFSIWSEYDPKAAGRWLKTLSSATQAQVMAKDENAPH